MTLKLRLLLLLCIVLAGIYAATPMWLPVVLAGKLPAGWHVERLDSGYPGLSGIKFNHLLLKGEIPGADMLLAVSDMRFGYSGPAANVGSLALEIRLRTADKSTATTRKLDDLSVPIIRPGGVLANISVAQLHVTIYPPAAIEAGHAISTPLLVLNFADLRLVPRPDRGFHLATHVNVGGLPMADGRLGVDARLDSLRADLRFPEVPGTLPWLAVSLEQLDQDDITTTRIRAGFDAGLADREWLGSILASATGGLLTHVDGRLEMQADFAGQDLLGIEHVSLTAEDLQLASNRGTLNIEAGLLASRDGETVTVKLPATAKIGYRDSTGWIDEFVHGVIPELQRTPWPQATGLLVFDSGSSLVVQNGTSPSARFDGGVDINLASSGRRFNLQLDDLQAWMADLREPETTIANGLVMLDWEEAAPLAYTSAELEAKADRLLLSNTGRLSIGPEAISFEQSGDFMAVFANLQASIQSGQSVRSDQFRMQGQIDFEQPMSAPGAPVELHFNGPVSAHNMRIGLPGNTHSPQPTVAAAELSAQLDVIAGEGILISTGSGTLMAGHIEPLATSAARIDLTWHEFDLAELAGSLTTKTQGFATELDGAAWTGFDLDLAYDLFANADASGSGTLMFDNGPQWAFEFSGNSQAARWDITLPAAAVKLQQLQRLLRVAHFELPAVIKLTDGDIELGGTVTAGDSIAANMLIAGHGLAASMQASSARNGSFLCNTTLGQSVTASGPVAIEAVTLAGGVDMTNVRADIAIENTETFGLQNLSAGLFGGQLMLRELRYADNGIEDSRAVLKHVDLGQLLAFADIDGLEGSGALDISLPVSSDAAGILVKNGTFESTGPGRLAYIKEGVAGGNIGLQALQNFHYQVLSGTVDYQSHGAYRMAIHLEGKNPDLYGGHPVVFNLSVNGSLPALFEALFLTGDFEESILKQLRIKQPE